jgi:hypothetical protein
MVWRLFEKSRVDGKRLSRRVRFNHKFGGLDAVFIVFAETAIPAVPSKASLRDAVRWVILNARCFRFTTFSFPAIPAQEIAGGENFHLCHAGRFDHLHSR